MPNTSRSGFTLIELSIVLVIVGLLSAAILVGKDLIRAAELRALITQIEQYDVAVNTFRLKYNCLPGDCNVATDFGLGTIGGDGDNGDGDGIIAQLVNNGYNGPERSNFWYHLGKAGLIAGEYPYGDIAGVNSPPAKLSGTKYAAGPGASNGGFWIVNGAPNDPFLSPDQHAWTIVSDAGLSSHSGVYLPAVAGEIDRKLDDSYPLAGRMVTINFKYTIPVMAGQCTPQIHSCDQILSPFTLSCVLGNTACLGGIGYGPDGAMIDDRVDPPIYNINATAPGFGTVGFPIIKSSSLN